MPSSTSIMRAGLLAASAATASSVIQGRQMTTTDCADVHLFLARGNTEPYPGRQKVLVAEVCDRVSTCDYEDIVFKDGADDVYCDSIYEGATNGYNQINAYNARCPDSKLVISGYSQGAHVVSDILAGGGGTFFGGCVEPDSPQLSRSSAAGQMVKAITTYGNVRHTADQAYNYGTGSANNSGYPRDAAQQELLNTYQDVWRDYCQIGDPVCARGDVVTDHTNYFDIFTYGAAEWIVDLIKGGSISSTTSSVVSSTASATPASSSAATIESSTAVASSVVSSAAASSSSVASSSAAASSAAVSSKAAAATSAATSAIATSSAAPTTSVPSSKSSGYPVSSAATSSATIATTAGSHYAASSSTASTAAVSSPTVKTCRRKRRAE